MSTANFEVIRPVRVGLVGAGPWAARAHVPMLTGGPETQLVGIWARNPARAAGLAAHAGCPAYAELPALLSACEAVAFAVPPDVQAALACEAARVGLALLLDKPLALEVASAHAVRDAVSAAGVPAMHMLSYRFSPRTRDFVAAARQRNWHGAHAEFVSGSLLPGSVYATPWRLQRGALPDLGPHALDLLQLALGPITRIHGAAQTPDWTGVVCSHASGCISTLALSGSVSPAGSRFRVALSGSGELALDSELDNLAPVFAEMRQTFAACVRNPSGPGATMAPNISDGVRLVELIHEIQEFATSGL